MQIEVLQVHPLKLFSIDELSELSGLPVSTIHAKRAAGEFPPGIKIGKHRRWPCKQYMEWIDTLSEKSQAA